MELLPGVHWIKTVRGGNAFLLADQEGLVLVDAGLPGSADKVLRYVRSLGRSPEELRSIVITHAHPDHFGGAAKLRKQTGAEIRVHRDDVGYDAQGAPHILLRGSPMGLGTRLFPKVPVDRLLEDEEVVPILGGLRVLHSPGHTPGSVCLLLERHEALFTGDMLLTTGRRFSRPLPFPGTNVQDYWRSLHGLTSLEFQAALPGHGRPFLEGGSQRLHLLLELYSEAAPRWWRAVRNIPVLMKFAMSFVGKQR